MGPVSEDEESVHELNLGGSKRLNEETEGDDLRHKKPRISEPIDETVGVLGEIGGQEKETIANGEIGFGEDTNQIVKDVSCGGAFSSCDDKRLGFDLNVPFFNAEEDGVLPVGAQTRVEIIDISSGDESDADGGSEGALEISDVKDVKGNGKDAEKQLIVYALLELSRMENSGRSSSVSGVVYTGEEKGKAKVHDSLLSGKQTLISDNIHRLGYSDSSPEHKQRFEESQGEENVLNDEHQFENYNAPAELRRRSPNPVERIHEPRHLEFLEYDRERRRRDILESGRRLAWSEDYVEVSSNQEKPRLEDDKLLGKSPCPFLLALKMIKEQKAKGPKLHFNWKPSYKSCNVSKNFASSLLDLSLKALSKNAEAIVSLEHVPDILRNRLSDLLCDSRKMNVHTLQLLVKGSPTEIRIKDCSWLTEEDFSNAFGNFDAKNLMVLQLDLCGQCMLDYLISKTLARFPKSLLKLGILSLKGAARLSDNGLKPLVSSAPALQSINLSQCSLVTHAGINILAASLGSILKELYIHDCQKIEAMLVLPALQKFEHLEVLSVAGIQSVSDQFVHGLINSCGQKIKELDLADCQCLTNYSLKVIGDVSRNLRSLNISNLGKVTDLGLQFLTEGCRSIQTLKLCRNKFSDEAIAAFLEVSGESLKDLSLNNVNLVGPCTAFSLAKCSRKLLSLDLSWCRKITDEELGLIVDSCLSLKLLKLFGCTQVTNVFLHGHTNPGVRVMGLKLTPILENINIVEPHGALLRYSPLASLSKLGSDDDQHG